MRRLHILLVEDNEGDILLTREALEEWEINHDLSVVKNGKDAMLFMLRETNFTDAKTPDLIFLDINLPKKSGHEVLEFLKKSEEFRQIPVIMLTTSSSSSDIIRAYRNHANCFVTKPVDVDEFLNTIAMIEGFWLRTAVLPSNPQV